MTNESAIRWAVEALSAARAVAVLTGAGVSAESGVPTFRGADGLWRTYRAEDLATPQAFARDPQLVWDWYRWRRQRMAAVLPNPGHLALARLESRIAGFTLITQNVDGLHARAGSTHIVELHGNIWRDRCANRLERHIVQHEPGECAWQDQAGVPRCACGEPMRPDIVWFGESLDPRNLQAAAEAFESANLALVVGTSSVVYPAAALPSMARRAGALVMEINPEETPLSGQADIVLRGPAGVILPELERLAFGTQ